MIRASVLFRILREARQCWPQLAIIAVLSLLSLPLALLAPLPIKIAVDGVLNRSLSPRLNQTLQFLHLGSSPLAAAIWILLGLAALISLQGLASWWLQTYVGERLVWDFRGRLLNHVQRLPLAFHDRYGAHDSVYRIQHDAPAIQYVLVQGIIPLGTALLTLIAMIYVTLRIDLTLAFLALAITPVLFGLSWVCSQFVRRRSQTVKSLDSTAMAVIEQALGSIRLIKAFSLEQQEYRRFVRHSGQRLRGQLNLSKFQAVFNMFIGLTLAAGNAAVLWVGIRHVQAGTLTVGSLLMVMAYITQMYQPLQLLTTKVSDLQGWIVSVERAFVLFDQTPEIEENPHARSISKARGAFEFRNVSFHYGNTGRGLENISFRVEAGTRVGIVGPTGAGKTTFLNLVMRFYDPNDGQVLLDDVDLREYRIADLRRQFAVVLQEPLMFDASFAENIAYGKPQATNEEIIAAAKAACAHEFIMNSPRQYDTNVGERGGLLSGGERQRISLARAFLRDSPILILDEPTSSVDVVTEAAIMRATQALMQGRTTFMIAHRLETLKSCDIILSLDQGRLVKIASSVPLATGAAR